MDAGLQLEKYSIGVGDRFAHQAKAQLRACMRAAAEGACVIPVWNKSNREHNIVGSEPASVRAAAETAVGELGWSRPYHVDADHIGLETVDRFLDSSDFYTLDVADAIGRPAETAEVDAFVARHPELIGRIELAGLGEPLEITRESAASAAGKYLGAVREAGRIYRHILARKSAGSFITEVSMDETDLPQTPPELLVILAAIADQGIPAQTIAPKFSGRFNKGVDYVGDPAQFEQEFSRDVAVIAHAVKSYGLPANLKLSVHSGSDKFSIYPAIHRTLARSGAGVHLKTAGTTWLEELIGLAEAGGEALALAKEVYAGAYAHGEELCRPYATVIDIDAARLPSPAEVAGWSSERFTAALRNQPACPEFNPHLRQLLHVGYKVAAQMGQRYLAMLRAAEEAVSRNVTFNLFERHLKPLFLAGGRGIPIGRAMPFIHEDFLLSNATSRRIYHKFAEAQPILDYHCHLPPKDIAENRRFRNLFEIWLEGDHYKWRAMRANGVDELYCTGDADPYEKFLAWAGTVPHTLRNPLFHWTHLELKRYFGIDELLDETNARRVWLAANEKLEGEDLRAQAILKKFRVAALCTTDDPADDLTWHKAIRDSALGTRVFPAFRPDKALNVHLPEAFNAWVNRLGAAAAVEIGGFQSFLDAIRVRHDYFHEMGGRLSDHGLNQCYADFCSQSVAAAIFDRARQGSAASTDEQRKFASFLMLYFGVLDAEKGWTKQLHLGARRNANNRMLQQLGPDVGFDSIGDWPQADALGAYLDRLEQENALPKTILYSLNPGDNYVLATMIGNFQDGRTAGKIQFGSAWWFLDQKEAMEWQINALSNCGLLSRFVGMLTDSRSFMSYPRHEYFRRVLSNLVGRDIEHGEIPDSDELVGPMIENICYGNAKRYLGLEI